FAIAGSVLFVGLLLAGVLYFTHERPAATPVAAIGDADKDRRQEEEQRLEQERKKLDEERTSLAKQKLQLDLARLKEQGQAALAKQRYDEAEQAFRAAL